MDAPSPEGLERIKGRLFAEPSAEELLDERFAQIALARRCLTGAQVDECVREQRRLREDGRRVRLIDVVLQRRLLSPEQTGTLLALQSRTQLVCEKCRRVYDITGHPAGTHVRCLGCGEELGPADPAEVGERDRPTPYSISRDGAENSRLRLGKYSLVREIARGGMGIVFEAEDPELKRRVALKILREDAAGPDVVARLHREAAIAAQLQHPNIVGIHEVGMLRDQAGRPTHFIAMDYIEGRTLAELLEERTTPRRELVRMLEEVARAVDHAHSQGVIHRDLKPANVLVDRSGRVILTDFGLARADRFTTALTQSHAVMGTPSYMAPEQVQGKTKEIGPRTDVYALGVTLYQILTGRVPFAAENLAKLYSQILHDLPVPPRRRGAGIEPELEVICLKALEKSREHRYATARAFADDLKRFLDDQPILARPFPSWRRWVRCTARNRGVLGAAGIVLAAALGAGAWVLVNAAKNRQRLAQERALHEKRESALRRLATLWMTIVERNRELRLGRLPPDQARRDLGRAVREVEDHVRDWPEDPQGYYVRARGKYYLGDFLGAEADVRAALARNADFRLGWSFLGMLGVEQARRSRGFWTLSSDLKEDAGNFESQLRAVQDSLSKGVEPGAQESEAQRWGLAWLREDQVMEQLIRAFVLKYVRQDSSGARRHLEEALSAYPAEEYVCCLGEWESGTEESERRLTKALELAPGYARPFLCRGLLRYSAKRYGEAIADLDRAIELEACPYDALFARALAKKESRALPGALADLTGVLEMCPDFLAALLERATLRRLLGDLPGAVADLDRVLPARGDIAKAWAERGVMKLELRDFAGARDDFDRALPLYLAAQNARACADVFWGRGKARLHLDDTSGAIEDIQEALRYAPSDWPGRGAAEAFLKETRRSSPK